MRVLVAYASTHGHTAKIAGRVAAGLRARGHEVYECRIGEQPDPLPADHDAVVIGASVHAGRHQREVVRWVREHHPSLNVCPSAFFSVSLTAADDSDEARERTARLVDELLDETGWIPQLTATFAGALQYREYDLPTRVLMRLIARHHHASTDVTEDVDFTDWDAVDRFAQRFAAEIEHWRARPGLR